jgi:Ni/Co efflux regulator RcnB
MKKLLLSVAAFAIVATTMTSCKKEYTCSCTILGQTQDTKFEKMSKADAEDKCKEASTGAAILGGSCSIK